MRRVCVRAFAFTRRGHVRHMFLANAHTHTHINWCFTCTWCRRRRRRRRRRSLCECVCVALSSANLVSKIIIMCTTQVFGLNNISESSTRHQMCATTGKMYDNFNHTYNYAFTNSNGFDYTCADVVVAAAVTTIAHDLPSKLYDILPHASRLTLSLSLSLSP